MTTVAEILAEPEIKEFCDKNTNLKSAFMLTRAVSKHMVRARAGRILNVSSVSGVMGNAGQANYAASKAGLIGFTKSVAKELGKRKITCNAIAPGFIATDMTDQLREEQKAYLLDQVPLKRLGIPADVASMVVYLASEEAAYITGQTFHVNGGMYMT